jgi:ferredoxin
VKKKLCIRCGECARACPVDAIYLAPSGEPYVCIHCGRCIPFCPHDCLELRVRQGEQPMRHNEATSSIERGGS